MSFEQWVGKVVNFYGVDSNAFCIGPLLTNPRQRLAFEVREDESDGYRSMMEEIEQVPIKGHIFFRTPIAQVRIERDTSIGGYVLVGCASEHTWLRFGTDHSDDYYPNFVFEYNPAKRVS